MGKYALIFLAVIVLFSVDAIGAQPVPPQKAGERLGEVRREIPELRAKIAAEEDPLERAKLNVELAEKKLVELEAMLEEKEVLFEAERERMSEQSERLVAEFERSIRSAEGEIERGRALGRDVTSALEVVEEATAKHIEVLYRVLDKVPEQAKGAIRHALEVSQRGRERALENLRRMKERPPRPERIEIEERPRRPERIGPPRGSGRPGR